MGTMLRAYAMDHGTNRRLEDGAGPEALRHAVWIDLLAPTPAELKSVEQAFNLELPSREEMREIELSSRVYREAAGTFMTASVLCRADAPVPEMMEVSFILAGGNGTAEPHALITLRHDDPKPFYGFHHQVGRQSLKLDNPSTTFVLLLDALLDRIADVLELTGRDVNQVGQALTLHTARLDSDTQHALLGRIARAHDLTAKARESLVTLTRLLAYATTAKDVLTDKGARARLKTLMQDAQSLSDYTAFLSSNINFHLDALLGTVGIEQNSIIKIFSVASVALLPPTLVATIYGMNFEVMPELSWPFGYPMALGLMVLSAVLPYLWFKKKGWL